MTHRSEIYGEAMSMLDGLPEGSVVLDVDGDAWQKQDVRWTSVARGANTELMGSNSLAILTPLTVVYRPDVESQGEPATDQPKLLDAAGVDQYFGDTCPDAVAVKDAHGVLYLLACNDEGPFYVGIPQGDDEFGTTVDDHNGFIERPTVGRYGPTYPLTVLATGIGCYGTNMRADIAELIERSSLGTPEAQALRATVSDEKAAALVAEAHRRSEVGGEGR